MGVSSCHRTALWFFAMYHQDDVKLLQLVQLSRMACGVWLTCRFRTRRAWRILRFVLPSKCATVALHLHIDEPWLSLLTAAVDECNFSQHCAAMGFAWVLRHPRKLIRTWFCQACMCMLRQVWRGLWDESRPWRSYICASLSAAQPEAGGSRLSVSKRRRRWD